MTDFDMSTPRTVTTGLRVPEGPVARDDGTVLVVEIEGAALVRLPPDGSKHPIAAAPLAPPRAASCTRSSGRGRATGSTSPADQRTHVRAGQHEIADLFVDAGAHP